MMMRLILFLLMMRVGLTNAGDFALIADYHNGTILAGSMDTRLSDLRALPLSGIEHPLAVDYDPVEKMVYWTDDDGGGKLSRAHLDGTNQETLYTDLPHAVGLALDTVARIVYWTDFTLGQVNRGHMDGTGSKETIAENLGNPSGIFTDHTKGHIYWTDVGENPQIVRANLDGTNRDTLISDGLKWPRAVIIEGSDLYWCDGFFADIEKTDLDGNNRMLFLNFTEHTNIRTYPYDLAIYEGYMYWSDLLFTTLIRVHLSGRGVEQFGNTHFQGPRRIHIQEEPNHCMSSTCRNGGTCDDVFDRFVCQCPPGIHGLTCTDDPCGSSPCLNGGTCTSPSPSQFICQCQTPYNEGPTCDFDACRSMPCLNGGTCTSSSAGFTCQCPANVHGPTCNIDPCGSWPCLNGGTCTSPSPSQFICQCQTSYEGPTCDVVDGCLPPSTSVHVTLLERNVPVFQSGNEATFICDNDYVDKGSGHHTAKRICRSDGSWSGEPVECFRDDHKKEFSVAVPAIAGGAGGFAILAVLLVVFLVLMKKYKKRNRPERVVRMQDIAAIAAMNDSTLFGDPPAYHNHFAGTTNTSVVRYSQAMAAAAGNSNVLKFKRPESPNTGVELPLEAHPYETVTFNN